MCEHKEGFYTKSTYSVKTFFDENGELVAENFKRISGGIKHYCVVCDEPIKEKPIDRDTDTP